MQVLQELLSLLEADFKKDQTVWVIQRDSRTKKEKKTMATVRATSGTAVTVSLKDEPNGKTAIERSQMGPGKAYDLKPRVDEASESQSAKITFMKSWYKAYGHMVDGATPTEATKDFWDTLSENPRKEAKAEDLGITDADVKSILKDLMKSKTNEAFANRDSGHKFVPQKKFIVKYKTKDGIATKTLTGYKVAEFKEKFGKDFISAQSAGRVDEAEGAKWHLYVEHPYGHGLDPTPVQPGEGVVDNEGNNVEFVQVIDQDTILIKRGREEEKVDVEKVDGVILPADEEPSGQGWMNEAKEVAPKTYFVVVKVGFDYGYHDRAGSAYAVFDAKDQAEAEAFLEKTDRIDWNDNDDHIHHMAQNVYGDNSASHGYTESAKIVTKMPKGSKYFGGYQIKDAKFED